MAENDQTKRRGGTMIWVSLGIVLLTVTVLIVMEKVLEKWEKDEQDRFL
jgi:ABC-type lipoprotein release transport system permease subunit